MTYNWENFHCGKHVDSYPSMHLWLDISSFQIEPIKWLVFTVGARAPGHFIFLHVKTASCLNAGRAFCERIFVVILQLLPFLCAHVHAIKSLYNYGQFVMNWVI